MENEQINLFRAKRAIVSLHKFCLDLLADLCKEHDDRINKCGDSLLDMEEFIQTSHGIDVDIAHLTKHFSFFDEERLKLIRKKILNHSEALQRELSEI